MSATATSSGISFPGMLTILFIALKLTGYVDWPWVWVLSPLWISVSLFLFVLLVAVIIAAVLKD